MGLQDRDYMRRRTHEPRDLGGSGTRARVTRAANWRTPLLVAGAVIAAGAVIWFGVRPAEGSLVVNINSATQEQLETVPGIGPALAGRIIAGRPYEDVDDLLRISGIGERNLASMRPFLKTAGETQRR